MQAMANNALRLAIVSLLLAQACGTRSVEERVALHVEKTCVTSSDCVIRIADLTDFAWDRMYVFDYGATREYVEAVLGRKYEGYREFRRKLIFLQGSRIIVDEQPWTDIEAPTDGEIVFSQRVGEMHASFTPQTAVFSVRSRREGDISYYVLDTVHRETVVDSHAPN
jgi:hypothetical protein